MNMVEQLFDAQRRKGVLEDVVFTEILDVLGLDHSDPKAWKFDDWSFDDYDNSFEVKGADPDLRFTPEQVDQLLALGFDRFWINHTDNWETYYWRHSREGFRKPKEKDAAWVRIGT